MGLFGKVFNKIVGDDSRTPNEIAFEKQVLSDGPHKAGKRIAEVVNVKITSQSLAMQFVLEELDAARQGNTHSIAFARNSGFSSNLYEGAMSKSKWQGDESELEHLQLYFRYFLLQIKDMELMVEVSVAAVDEIMKIWKFGKYHK